jgi:Ser/Thr protein kinase RdoA (MazF antagonist)
VSNVDDRIDESQERVPHAYDALTPDAILTAVEGCGLLCDGRLLALNSYENRVYRVGIEDAEPVIAKFYRPGRWTDAAIEEEHEFALELAAHEIPVVAPIADDDGRTVHTDGTFKFALFPLRPGRWPELESYADRLSLGRFMGRIHSIGALRPFFERFTLDAQSHGYGPFAALLQSRCVPAELKHNLEMAGMALLCAADERLQAHAQTRRIRVHGDFHLGNVLWSELGPSIVDLDDCCMSWPVQDLWMLLDGERDAMQGQLIDVLEGYLEFSDFDYSTVGLIEALRALRMVRFNGWVAERWGDPAFPIAFPWFDTPQHWERQIVAFREQLERLDDPPLDVM